MFKIIKKWYFKIYHLFKLLGIFILVFGIKENVFAEECNNLYKGEPGNVWVRSTIYQIVSSLNGASGYNTNISTTCTPENKICIDKSKTYTIYAVDQNGEIVNLWVEGMTNIKLLGQTFLASSESKDRYTLEGKYMGNGNVWQYTFPSNIEIPTTEAYQKINGWQWYVVEGTEICLPEGEEEPTEDNVYSNFLTLYVDRINYLATGFTSNPYLIAMVSIIIAWGVLELTIKIINIRRRK